MTSLEQLAQTFTSFVCSQLGANIALARVYAIVPFESLPDDAHGFATTLAQSKNLTLNPSTPILSLLGTSGAKPEWNDRARSRGHLAIPLASTSFVMGIPMISRLVTEMGGNLKMFDTVRVGAARRLTMTGLFHVRDAATAKDSEDRLIIPAREFVAEERIKSVFAAGTTTSDGLFITALLFVREVVERPQAQRFLPVLELLKSATAKHVGLGRVFAKPAKRLTLA
jgi:hypothetical protein